MSPRVDWDTVPDAPTYEPLPVGWYRVKVENCTETLTRTQDTMFGIVFVVQDGVHAGRKLFDNIIFSEKCYSRAKLVCKRLGLSVEGIANVEPADLLGKEVMIQTSGFETYLKDGNERIKNVIPFDGYRSLDNEVDEKGQPLPF
jgi:hypothetical protein